MRTRQITKISGLFPDTCVEGCLRYSDCLETDYGLFSEVRYFQLGGIGIPDELNQRFLKALVLQEENETEKLRQESQVVRKETQAQVGMSGSLTATALPSVCFGIWSRCRDRGSARHNFAIPQRFGCSRRDFAMRSTFP